MSGDQEAAVFRDMLAEGGFGPEMLPLRGGRFVMGGTRAAEGQPAHPVSVRAFALGRYPVTFEEYDVFCAAVGLEPPPSDEGWGRGRRPAVNVSCEDAQSYCRWLAEETGKGYRLPSEAEWEFACAAGSETLWSFGDDADAADNYAWFNENSGGRTQPVGAKKPNPWGLYDMHGHVWEWCEDNWSETYAGAPADGSAWMEGDAAIGAMRGGSWSSKARVLRTRTRCAAPRINRTPRIGFRVARDLRLA